MGHKTVDRSWALVRHVSLRYFVDVGCKSSSKETERARTLGIRLGTDHDVDEMLNVGWDGHRVFKREMVGYRDNDSMLLGGFQHIHRMQMSSATTSTT